MVALLVLFVAAALVVAGVVLSPLGVPGGLIVAGVIVAVAGFDLLRPDPPRPL